VLYSIYIFRLSTSLLYREVLFLFRLFGLIRQLHPGTIGLSTTLPSKTNDPTPSHSSMTQIIV
jgi:hypothetical protein